MENIPEIQSRLSRLLDRNNIYQQLTETSTKAKLTEEDIERLNSSLTLLVHKIIKHLQTKTPSKSGILGLINRSLFKLQYNGLRFEAQETYCNIITDIINENFDKNFFNRRLNVKSKEFLDLKDCEPF